MNERIKELLQQPVFERLKDWYDIGPVQKATLEEFAELIIKECANHILNTSDRYRKEYFAGKVMELIDK